MRRLKISIAVSMMISILSIIPSSLVYGEDTVNNEDEVNDSSTKDAEEYVEEEIENYIFDEDGNIIGIAEDAIEYKELPAPRASINYGKGYLDFMGSASRVLNVYTSSTSGTAYTYFNTGSGERVATLGQSGSRIKIVINGYVGWIDKTSYVQNAKWYSVGSVPSNYTEYYTKNSSGALVYTYAYYETTTSILVGHAPNFMSTSTKYYSLDGIYFYTNRSTMFNDKASNSTSNSLNKSNPYYNYYQYLPFRSTTNLTTDDFYNYLASRLNSSNLQASALNNRSVLNQFFISEESHSVNAALEFSMALLESGYGTSQIAREKNNLFGWGAVDSGPYAGAYKFPSVSAGIEYHAKSAISSGYLDTMLDFRYYGGNIGNKNNGLNVKYASDPYWGMKIAGIYYGMDKQAGFKDYNYYQLAIQSKGTGTQAYYLGQYKYNLKNNRTGLNVTNMPFIVVGESSTQYSIVSDTGICNPGDSKYDYYIDQSTLKVEKRYYTCSNNSVHFSADVTFDNDIVQVGKSNFYITGSNTIKKPGSGTYEVVVGDMVYVMNNDDSINHAYKLNSDGTIPTYYEFLSGSTIENALSRVEYKFNMHVGNNTIINAEYYLNGKIKRYYEYAPNTNFGNHGSRILLVFNMNTANDIINYAIMFKSGTAVRYYTYQNNTPYGNHGSKIEYVYNIKNGSIAYADHYVNGVKLYVYEFVDGTKFDGEQLDKKLYVFNINSDGTIKNAYQVNSEDKVVRYFEYETGTRHGGLNGGHGGKIKFVFNMNIENDTINYAYMIKSGSVVKYYTYQNNTPYGNHGSKIEYIYIMKNGSIAYADRYVNGVKVYIYEFISGTKFDGMQLDKKLYVFNINSDGTIKNAYQVNSDDKIVRYFEYDTGTKHGGLNGGHGGKIKYVFNMNVSKDTIDYAYYTSSGKIRRYYEYEENTQYGNHGSKIIATYVTNESSNYIVKATIHKGESAEIYEYYSPVSYQNRNSNIKHIFYIENGSLLGADLRDANNRVVRHYEYRSGTVYGSHNDKIMFIFNVSPITGEIIEAYALDSNWKKIRRYTYEAGTKYDIKGSHGKHIITSEPV